MRRVLSAVPLALIALRVTLGPVIVGTGYIFGLRAAPFIVACIGFGLLSDIFDGVIARRLQIATPVLRRMDSQADLIFWLSILVCSWILRPSEVQELLPYFFILLGLEFACYATSFIKFGRETCTHSYLSKLWGISLCISFVLLIATGDHGPAFATMFIVGAASQLEVIGITLVLPAWTNDVPSLYHAWKIRRSIHAVP